MTKLSLRGAINAYCRSCIHDPYGGGGQWREQVDACTSANCPLRPVRPRTYRGEKAQPAPEEAAPDVEPADDAEPSVDELLAQAFGANR